MSGRRYAEGTTVPVESSMREVQALLKGWGVRDFLMGHEGGRDVLAFKYDGRVVRLEIRRPNPDDFRRTPGGVIRYSLKDREVAAEKEYMRRWRALILLLKAKIEAIRDDVSDFNTEFGMWVQLPDGRTVAETVAEDVDTFYSTGRIAPLLPGGSALALGPGGGR